MINFLNEYTTKILFLSIFIGLIQMILPKGKIKQNVLFTSMIVITIVIVEPLVEFLNNDIEVSDIYAKNEMEYRKIEKDFDYESYYNKKVKDTYEENLRNDMVKRLEDAGYKINSIECECDEKTLEPKSLKVEIETKDGFVQPVRIEISSNYKNEREANLEDKIKIQKIAYENYGIKNENVVVKTN